MIKTEVLITILCFILNCVSVHSQKIIFLHHSTGTNVYNQGGVSSWFANYNSVNGTGYIINERAYPDTPYPWENYPYDYWNLWLNNACDNTDPDIECMDKLCTDYDVIIFKHCFPGAGISADIASPSVSSSIKCLANYKLQYRSLRSLMDGFPNKKFIVWTLVPLHRLATNVQSAARAREFVDWVKNDWLTEDGKSHPNIFVFDFFGLAAELNPSPVNGQTNCLKYDYEGDHTTNDSHPNLLANQTIGPIFAQFIVNTIEDNTTIPITSISVTGVGGISSIAIDNGTLQLTSTILPANATNKNVTWSIQNGTGEATINSNGLVTAVSNGTVTARATAQDGSAVYGTLIITISNQTIPVTGITVTGAGGVSSVTTDNGTLQLSASILPANATNKIVTWSIQNGTGEATISTSGLVTAISSGTVTARATAQDGSAVYGTLIITISNQTIPVTGITVTGAGGVSSVTTDNGTLQLSASILPANATNKNVTWSIQNGTGEATINSTGLVTAVSNGTVTACATAQDGSSVFGTLVITISNQVIPVTGITVTGAGGVSSITADNGSLQLSATILPANATNKNVTWSIQNGTGDGSINNSGQVMAIANGTVTARATAQDGSGVFGTLVITISNQVISVSSITVTGAGGISSITADNGSLQLSATVLPANATNKDVTWSIQNLTGQASINSGGLVTAVASGTVTARATTQDGSGVFGTLVITISNQVIPVTGITVTGAGGVSSITADNGTLQLSATVLPANATNKNVTWSIQNGTGEASINSDGLVTAVAIGTVTVSATAQDGSAVFGTLVITITNQIIPVTDITVTGAGGVSSITTDNGTLQLNATILPANASNKNVTWSIQNGTGEATISNNGLVTAISNGTVVVTAFANGGSEVFASINISISNQRIPVSKIEVIGVNGSSTINSISGTLQVTTIISPENAYDKSINWTIINNTGEATISSTGLVTAVSEGIVIVVALANDGSGITDSMQITIKIGFVPLQSIIVYTLNFDNIIENTDSTLLMYVHPFPETASNREVIWSVENVTGDAIIDEYGMLKGISNGIVLVKAVSIENKSIFGLLEITINDPRLITSFSSNTNIHFTYIQTFDYVKLFFEYPTLREIQVVDLTGRVINCGITTDIEYIINYKKLPRGIYIVHFYEVINNQSFVHKFAY